MRFLTEIQIMKDGTKAALPITFFDSAKSAEIAFHQAVASNMASEVLGSFLVTVTTETGYTELSRYYNFSEEE